MDLVRLKRAAVAWTMFAPTTLKNATSRLQFVQADPIRAPSRAQDLILRHRVKGYREGQLDTQYAKLGVEEDMFLNYGFLTAEVWSLLHPRTPRRKWSAKDTARAEEIEQFIRGRGHTHPDDVEAAFAHGKVTNAWGGTSRAGTALLQQLHYRGRLRVARRENGIRVYESRALTEQPLSDRERAEALIDVAVNLYAPVPERSLGVLASFLRWAAPQLQGELRNATKRLRVELPGVELDGKRWLWPRGTGPKSPGEPEDVVRLLAPFDPLVWDRLRFQKLWGWEYRFEAYTPKAKRVRGYYALPLLWRDDVIGWANVGGADEIELGFASGQAPKDRAFASAMEAERERLRGFLSRLPL